MFRQCILWISIVFIASAGWAQTETTDLASAPTPVADSALIPMQSPNALPTAELNPSQLALLEKASNPATAELTREEIKRLQSEPEIQEVGAACCMADCWVAWGVCMDTCTGASDTQACRNQCRAERRQCLDDCDQF